ncbi:hypothetical protein M758_8G105800 [Ceratodon purpureus]|nr:hypothetical protein M758_8G105800 [Ceratodon purpureus]
MFLLDLCSSLKWSCEGYRIFDWVEKRRTLLVRTPGSRLIYGSSRWSNSIKHDYKICSSHQTICPFENIYFPMIADLASWQKVANRKRCSL